MQTCEHHADGFEQRDLQQESQRYGTLLKSPKTHMNMHYTSVNEEQEQYQRSQSSEIHLKYAYMYRIKTK